MKDIHGGARGWGRGVEELPGRAPPGTSTCSHPRLPNPCTSGFCRGPVVDQGAGAGRGVHPSDHQPTSSESHVVGVNPGKGARGLFRTTAQAAHSLRRWKGTGNSRPRRHTRWREAQRDSCKEALGWETESPRQGGQVTVPGAPVQTSQAYTTSRPCAASLPPSPAPAHTPVPPRRSGLSLRRAHPLSSGQRDFGWGGGP